MTERDNALKMANAVLDRPYADPDDDLAIIARQFIRCNESCVRTWSALEKSVALQSHYAELLNMSDGGKRMKFTDAWAWFDRLSSLGELPKNDDQ